MQYILLETFEVWQISALAERMHRCGLPAVSPCRPGARARDARRDLPGFVCNYIQVREGGKSETSTKKI